MKLLVIRSSAMGDVALLTPVLRSMENQYPDVEIVLVTRPAFEPFFLSLKNVRLLSADFRKRHNGLFGILRLKKDIDRTHRIDRVLDLHNVIRSKILRLLFRFSGKQVFVIDKGRTQKRDLINGKTKIRLTHSADRYFDVFNKAGFKPSKNPGPWLIPTARGEKRAEQLHSEKELIHIGIAPYAKHDLKMWPEENMISLMEMIASSRKVRFWLFGGKEETPQLVNMQTKIPEAELVAGTLNMDEEIALIGRIDFMISMDSSNMHIAALAGTKVISIWGATDPLAGFSAWEQPDEYSLRVPVEELNCRPCSIYGKGKCRRKDFACMNRLTTEIVFNKLKEMKLI
jgi:ADP-heptose:LPS heptosyltransferase